MPTTSEIDRLRDAVVDNIADAACIDERTEGVLNIIKLSSSVMDLLEDIDTHMMEHA